MKLRVPAALACMMLAPAALFAAAFEGKVSFKMTNAGAAPQELAYLIKGGKLRLEMPGQNGMGGMIIDPAKKQSVVLLDQQKMYMVMPIPDLAAQAQDAASTGDVKLESTGQKEKIIGYDTEKYIATHQGTRTELWLAEGLGSFMAVPQNPMGGRRGGGAPAMQGWEQALAGRELFPLRVVTREPDGGEKFRLETTAIEKKPLPATLFSPPAGYQLLDMGAMMKGMMPGARN